MHLIRRIIIGLGITIAAVCFGAIVLFNWSVTGFRALTVPTGSMRPNINPGALVLVRRVPINSLHVGDVITYANPLQKGSTISHRITKTYLLDGKVPAFITQGDANPTADRPVVGGQVEGKVIGSVPHVGEWLSWTHTWVGIAVIIYLPALIVMIQEIRRLSAYYRQFVPYKAALILAREEAMAKAARTKHKLASIPAVSLALLFGSIFIAFPAHALLASNTVSLGPNTLTVAATNTGGGGNTGGGNTNTNTSCQNNNNINVNTSNNQTATTGSTNNSGNTTGGSATSGNATNNSNTNISITNTNGC